MGRDKDRLLAEEDAWDGIAHEKGYICSRCGNVIPKSELDTVLQEPPWECGLCRHITSKDD